MKYLARVKPRYFAAMQRCSADQDHRFYLCSVYIERHPKAGVVLVATDGHTMAVIHDPSGWLHTDHQHLIIQRTSKRMVSAITKNKTMDMTPEQLWIAESCLVLSGNADTSEEPDPFGPMAICAERSAVIDAKYPDWRRVIPKGESSPCPSVNSEYLARFNDVARILSGSKYFPGGGMTLITSGETTSLIVRMHGTDLDERFLGLIMPMRADKLPSVVPGFISAWPESQP